MAWEFRIAEKRGSCERGVLVTFFLRCRTGAGKELIRSPMSVSTE